MRTAHAEERTLFILSCYRQAALIPLDVLRCVFMFCVIALYALMGTPTPDRIGLLEIVIGALLFTVIIRPELYVMWKRPFFTDMDWPQAGRLVLFFAVSVPFLGGVMQGNAPALILRDVIWLGFITLPVLLAGLFSARQYRWLVVICVAGGVILALREIVRVLGVHFFLLGGAEATSYLGNSPLVLFAAIMLAGYGMVTLMEAPHVRGVTAGLLSLFVSLIPLGAMIMGMQRASLGLFMLAVVLIGFAGLRARPFRALPYLAVCIGLLAMFWQELGALGALMMDKTAQVGLNRRAEEWLAVWDHIRTYPLGAFFGTGWGGVYNSPAVGGMSVNFTHGALSSVLLKTGCVGLFVFGLYFYALGRKIWNNALRTPNLRGLVFSSALLCPFLIDIFLYASFKSFDFGVLLVLMAFAPRLLAVKEQQILVSGDKSL